MADHQPILREVYPGWTALLPGLIPALIFVAVHGMRHSYELFKVINASFQGYVIWPITALDRHPAYLVGIAPTLAVGSLMLIIRLVRRNRASRLLAAAD